MGIRRILFIFVTITAKLCSGSDKDVDPCQRQQFKSRCTDSQNSSVEIRSQFVLRYYHRNAECVSYPYGHCPGDFDGPRLFKYKNECEEQCIASKGSWRNGSATHEKLSTEGSGPRTLKPRNKGGPLRSMAITAKMADVGQVTIQQPVKPVIEQTVPESQIQQVKTSVEQQQAVPQQVQLQPTQGGFPGPSNKQDQPVIGKERPDVGGINLQGFTPCQQQRALTIKRSENVPVRQRPYIPLCTPDGAFKPLQCGSPGNCWCVSENGTEVPGTRTRPSQPRPLCGHSAELAPQGPTTPEPVPARSGVAPNNCKASMDVGPCTSYTARWFYNFAAQECSRFEYGGCGGNDNNYFTRDECELQCQQGPKKLCASGSPLIDWNGLMYDCSNGTCPEGHKCSITPKVAVCCPKTAADENEVAAELTTDSVPEVCLKERDRGRCDKFQQRYHYDHRKQECNIFFYGGCGGNENNFASEAECIRVCGRRAAAGGAANNNVSGQTPSVSNPSNQRSASASSEGGVTLPRVISLVEEVSVFDAATATNKLNSTKISEALLNHVKSTSKSQKSAAASEGSKKLPPSSRQRSKVPPTAAGGQRTFVENAPVLKENGSSFEFFGKLFETVPGNESSSSVELGNDFGKIDQSSFGENSKQSDEQLPLMPKDHFAGPVPTEAGQLNTSQTDQSEQSLLITQPIPLVETSQSNESIPPTEQVQTSPIKEQGDGVNQHLSVLQPTQHLNLQDQGRPIGNPLPLPPPTLGRPNVPPGQTANTPLCSPAPPACNPGCAISTDRFGCPVCFCAPLQAPRGAQVQKFQQLPRSCPFVSAETCPEPCLIIRERNGCQRCECHDPNGPLLAPQATPPALQQRNLQSGFGPLQPNRQQFPVQQAPQTNFPGSFQTSSFPSHSPVITSPLATSSTTNATFTVVNNTPATASVDTSETSQTNSGFTAITAGNDTTKLASPVFVSANATEQPVSPTVAAISSVSDEFEKCEQEKDPGPCTNFIIRYYFNATLKKCEEFQYGGCAGNRNHFYTLEQCLLHCERHFQTPSTTGTTVFRPEAAIREPVSVPQRPPQDQINLQVIPRVHNQTNWSPIPIGVSSLRPLVPTGGSPQVQVPLPQIPVFTPNPPPFPQTGAIQQGPSPFGPQPLQLPAPCGLVLDPGSCREFTFRFFFNVNTLNCEQFTWTGCRANANNFATREECEALCPFHGQLPPNPQQQFNRTTLPDLLPVENQFNQFPQPVFNPQFPFPQPPPQSQEVVPQLPNQQFPFPQQQQLATDLRPPLSQLVPPQQQQQQFTGVPEIISRPLFPIAPAQQQGIIAEASLPVSGLQAPGQNPEPVLSPQEQVLRQQILQQLLRQQQSQFAANQGQGSHPDFGPAAVLRPNGSVFAPSDQFAFPSGFHGLTRLAPQSTPIVDYSYDPEVVTEPHTDGSETVEDAGDGQEEDTESELPPPPNQVGGLLGLQNSSPFFPKPPQCPRGGKPTKTGDGNPFVCLPGQDQCPAGSSCFFNGFDFFCCSVAEEPVADNAGTLWGGPPQRTDTPREPNSISPAPQNQVPPALGARAAQGSRLDQSRVSNPGPLVPTGGLFSQFG